MGDFGLYAHEKASGRAKCQLCGKLVEKGSAAVCAVHFYMNQRGYFHPDCVAGVLDGLNTETKGGENGTVLS